MYVRPRLWIGLLPIVVFIVWQVWQGLQPTPTPSDADAPVVTVDSFNALAALVTLIFPDGLLVICVTLIVLGLGWGRLVWSEGGARSPWTMWMLAPIAVAVFAAVQLPWGHPFRADPLDLAAIAGGTLLVGLFEELSTRGVLLVGARGRLSELWVLIVTSVVFGALHSLNIFSQSPAETLNQVGYAMLFGATLYLVRRVTGSLVWAVLLHAFWDFVTFTFNTTVGSTPPDWFDWITYALLAAGTVGAVVVARRSASTQPARVAAVVDARTGRRSAKRLARAA